MEFWSPVFWIGSQVPCLQMTIYFGSSDYPKVINFCGNVFFFFCHLEDEKMSKSDRRKLMVVSLTQGGRKLKGAKYKESEFSWE